MIAVKLNYFSLTRGPEEIERKTFLSSLSIMSKFFNYKSEVFFEEMDAIGMLHHPRYLYHVERAQQYFFQHLLGVNDFNSERDEDIYVVVRSIQLELLQPMKNPGFINIQIEVLKVRGGATTLGFNIFDADQQTLFAHGNRVVCKLSGKNHSPTLWTEHFRHKLEAYL